MALCSGTTISPEALAQYAPLAKAQGAPIPLGVTDNKPDPVMTVNPDGTVTYIKSCQEPTYGDGISTSSTSTTQQTGSQQTTTTPDFSWGGSLISGLPNEYLYLGAGGLLLLLMMRGR